MAVDVVHERGYLLLVNIHLFNLVHGAVELFGADFLRCGQRAVYKLLADFLLDLSHLVLLAGVDDADRRALLAGAARAARAVGVVLDVVGQSVVDDVGQVVYVESAGGHVGGHEQLHGVLAELLHGQVALVLREVAVQGLGVVSVLDELVGNLLRLQLGAAEDDGEDARMEVNDALQGEVFVLCVHEIVDVVDVFGALVARTNHDFSVVVQVGLGDALNLAAHRSREHQRSALLGQMFENLVDALREAHVQHLVGLVEHHVAHAGEVGDAAVHQVDESARRGHDDLCTALHRANLLHHRRAAIDGHHVHAGHVFGKVLQVVADLQAQLARRAQDEGLRGAVVGVEPLQQGNAEGCRLASARLGQGDEVLLWSSDRAAACGETGLGLFLCFSSIFGGLGGDGRGVKEIRDYLLLNRHWLFEAQFADGAANILADAQFFKCFQCIVCFFC